MSVTGQDTSVSGIVAPTTFGVLGDAGPGNGVIGVSRDATGVFGQSDLAGAGEFPSHAFGGIGVHGKNTKAGGTGVQGEGGSRGVLGFVSSGTGVYGIASGVGVANNGVRGDCLHGFGVSGVSSNGYGVGGYGGNIGVYAHNYTVEGHDAYLATRGLAGDFYGDVFVHGQLIKSAGYFKIDHPLDPANKYLYHSFVESPDRKNIYDEVAVLDRRGEAEVHLPAWFEALNKDFRYQLTCVGGHAPVYIAQEIKTNQFKIAGGSPGMKVSWQVTGVRQDAWAEANPVLVEEDKPAEERGHFLQPSAHGAPEEKSVQWARYPRAEQATPHGLAAPAKPGTTP